MKTITVKQARQQLAALREGIASDGLNLDAIERFAGDWQIFYNGQCVGNHMPAHAAPYALHTMWLFLRKNLINKNF